MAVLVEKLNELNKTISLKRFFGSIFPRFDNGRITQIEAKVVLKENHEVERFHDFVKSLNERE